MALKAGTTRRNLADVHQIPKTKKSLLILLVMLMTFSASCTWKKNENWGWELNRKDGVTNLFLSSKYILVTI